VVPGDGFYEWKKVDPKTKQPYAFAVTDREPSPSPACGTYGRNPMAAGFRTSASSPQTLTSFSVQGYVQQNTGQ
jgi:hypothetical protein